MAALRSMEADRALVHPQDLIAEQTDDRAECVMCLGHNKGWEEAASSFAVCISASFAL